MKCPSNIDDIDIEYFKPYTNLFHCGYATFVERRYPTPDNPCIECVYDDTGLLITDGPCKGTANDFNPGLRHILIDRGGILKNLKAACRALLRYCF